MQKKHCLFCDVIVPIRADGEYDRYGGCSCTPDGFYLLQRDHYDRIHSYPYQKKRDLFHLVSAYIRELTDCGKKVRLSIEALEAVAYSPNIPVSIEDKGKRLLHYLHRHSEGPGDPVVIRNLSSSYNLTYSPNLQELVYIMDKLIGDRLLIREGMTYKLTEKGWSEAAATAAGKEAKPCLVLISDEEESNPMWPDKLLPKIEQCGFIPSLISFSNKGSRPKTTLEQIADSKLIVADLTGPAHGVYFAAGYGLGLNIPVIWTVNGRHADQLPVKIEGVAPILWETVEELAEILQTRLNTK